MERTLHAVWPRATKTKINISLQACETEGLLNVLTTCFRKQSIPRTYPISTIVSFAWRQALPGPCAHFSVWPLWSQPSQPPVPTPTPSPASTASSSSSAVSIVNGYCYEWGPLHLFLHWQAPGRQMDRLLLLLCYQESPDTGPRTSGTK